MKLFKSLPFQALFILIIFVSSFAGSALPGSTVDRTIKRPTTAAILDMLGGYPCPDDSYFTCVTIEVPLDHFNPADTRTIPATFAVLPATGNRKGMFVVATGGPGTSGVALADYYSSTYQDAIFRRFDIVFFDQRGVGLSGGLTCPEAAVDYYRRDPQAETPEEQSALADSARTFAEDCVAEMGNSEILPYLGTDQAIEDLEYFRTLMKDKKFWLYGESYGTQYAQTYAAKYGSHLAGMILDGTVDLTLTGFEFYAQQAQAFNDTLTATLQACNDDPYCVEDIGVNANGGPPKSKKTSADAIEAYDNLAELLQAKPIPFDFPLPEGGFEERFFTFADLEVVAAGQMYSEGDRMMFNRALASAAAYGNLVPLARLLYLALGVDPQTLEVIPDPSYSDAVFYAVECQDYGYPGNTPEERIENYFAAGEQVVPFIPRLGSVFYGDAPCPFWPDATTDLTRPEPLTARGIPTLVLNATADPATPISNAISVFERLDDGYLITQEGGPHVIFGWGNACPDDIVTRFLVNGKTPNQRITNCDGVTVEEYVPVSPTDASEFVDLLDAFGWTETEINYLPEYYYWDGFTPSQVGCPLGGTLAFESDGESNFYTLDGCSFATDLIMTGAGSYHFDRDRFILNVSLDGRWDCDVRYRRIGEKTVITGKCGGKIVAENGKSDSPVLDTKITPHPKTGK